MPRRRGPDVAVEGDQDMPSNKPFGSIKNKHKHPKTTGVQIKLKEGAIVWSPLEIDFPRQLGLW